MQGIINWIRSFTYDANGSIVYSNEQPVFAAHPQPNLWALLKSTAVEINFDFVQCPPWSNGSGEGYTPFQHRNLNSNWGTENELAEAIIALYATGKRICMDLPFRQMNGENDGPGGFNYALSIDYNFPDAHENLWDLTAKDFQCFNQSGETIPPFQQQDSVIDPTGNYPFGRVLSLQHSPDGYVMNDLISILSYYITKLGLIPKFTLSRWDDLKGTNGACVLLIMRTQPDVTFVGEVDTGNQTELEWVAVTVMQERTSLEGYDQYWNTQRACNNYDSRQFDVGGPQLWQRNSNLCFVFTNNPDVATTWSPTGGISQQIAFNLLLGIMHDMFLPCKAYLTYAEDYYPASPDYPTGRGFKPYIDNGVWFAEKFAFGNFERRWVDKDVYVYTRDGNGGEIGWSGGCLIALNFNTYDIRYVDVQTMWPEGTILHNYSITGNNEDYTVGVGGMLSLALKANYLSDGQSYYLIAVKGVSGAIVRPALN